ncbi:AAA family ATPase [Alphaproteobacteria bacterium KMM 3653]|uniref:AAA family ATPase n=1 Tax=Harenicola maris TaxID=2841044 RepID=A0AAP2CLQ4_9RHOB|nr:AAA family ATPase [Harenicola maris]
MRLNQLQLTRYGRFMDAVIPFPRPGKGTVDVTVIYGPNEAGKSTAFHAFLELLFGFKAGAHPFAFRFERKDLLVGAELDLPGRGPMTFQRNSKRANSLTDAEGRPLNEAVLSGALHGLTRDAFEERFSLNDAGLREGGARIAGAQGDLGQLLHAGISGLTGMAETLDALSARADRFHKPRGRGTELNLGREKLTEISRALRAGRLTVERERDLRRKCDAARTVFEAAKVELAQAHQRQAAASAAQLWFEKGQDIAELEEALAKYPEGPDLQSGAPERVVELVAGIAAAERRIAEGKAEKATLDQVISDNAIDPLADDLASELARLDAMVIDDGPLMARAGTAQADVARRKRDRDDLADQMAAFLREMGVDGPAVEFVLPAERLEAMTLAVQDCVTTLPAAKAAREAVEDARAQLGETPEEPVDLTDLTAGFAAWSAASDIAVQMAEVAQTEARLTKATAELPGSWAGLIDAGLPAQATLEAAARDWARLQAEKDVAEASLDTRADELAQAQAALSSLKDTPGAVDVGQIEETRRQRDMAWQRHSEDLSSPTAEAFEAAMQGDDVARAHFLTGAEARERLRGAQEEAQGAKARHQRAQAQAQKSGAELEALAERCAGLSLLLGLPQDTPPNGFAARYQALSGAAIASAEHVNAHAALKAASTQREAAERRLEAVARAVGIEASIEGLPARVQKRLNSEESVQRTWDNWLAGQEKLVRLGEKAKGAQDAATAAERALSALAADVSLSDRSASGIGAALPQLRILAQLHGQHQALSQRITGLETAIEALDAGAKRLSKLMGEDNAQGAMAIVDLARRRVSEAERADTRREQASERLLEVQRRVKSAEDDLKSATKDLAAGFAGQGGADMESRARIAQLAERDRLRRESRTAEQDRAKVRSGVDAGLFAQELERLPDAGRAMELAQASEDAQSARDAARDVEREADRLYREAFDADDQSALVTRQAVLREELRAGARQAAVARLGVLAARGALRKLAEERRSHMLRDVEDAFVTITAPDWEGVDVWSQAEGQKLVGVQPGGARVPVEQMSTGTMGQLYFALRLAGYRAFARDPGPLPMVLDDIMETFDDTRARAALQLCAQIGADGQAILFTHHAHLVDLARETIPEVSIVEMPGR